MNKISRTGLEDKLTIMGKYMKVSIIMGRDKVLAGHFQVMVNITKGNGSKISSTGMAK